jgi:hypothetical protein
MEEPTAPLTTEGVTTSEAATGSKELVEGGSVSSSPHAPAAVVAQLINANRFASFARWNVQTM